MKVLSGYFLLLIVKLIGESAVVSRLVSSKIHVLNLNAQCDDIRRWSHWEVLRS